MVNACLAFGWCWLTAGLLSGVGIGLFFHNDDWLGGYDHWSRRLVRLGHVAFFGTGMLNVLYALTARSAQGSDPWPDWPGGLLITGAVLMPLICFTAAWRRELRLLFAAPIVCLVGGVGATTVMVLRSVLSGG